MIQEKKRSAPFDTRDTVLRATILAISSAISFWLVTHILASVYSISRDGDVSFGLCFVYLLIFPFYVWGMAGLIAIGAIALRR